MIAAGTFNKLSGTWGCSSVGRALALQARCRVFDSRQLHQIVWSRTLKRKQYLKVDGDDASAEIRENNNNVATVNGQNSTGK